MARTLLLAALIALCGADGAAHASEGAGPHPRHDYYKAAKQLAPDPRSYVVGEAWEVAVVSSCDNPSSPNCDAAKQQGGLVGALMAIVGMALVLVPVLIVKRMG